jgi:hypothetical protein
VWERGTFYEVDDFDMRNTYNEQAPYELLSTELTIRSGQREWSATGVPEGWLPLRHRARDEHGNPALLRIVKSPTRWRFADGRAGTGMSEIHDRLDAAGCLPVAQVWVEEGEAIDLQFGRDSDAARAALEGQGYDVVVQPAEDRRKKLIVADMDSTMITVEPTTYSPLASSASSTRTLPTRCAVREGGVCTWMRGCSRRSTRVRIRSRSS